MNVCHLACFTKLQPKIMGFSKYYYKYYTKSKHFAMELTKLVTM